MSKSIYPELISVLVPPPTAQSRYNESFDTVPLNWKEIYSLAFKVALDTKSREFQYKILQVSIDQYIFEENRKNKLFSLLLCFLVWLTNPSNISL